MLDPNDNSPNLGISRSLGLADTFALYEKTLPEINNLLSELMSGLDSAVSTLLDVTSDVSLNLLEGFSDES
jgi:hypothetical protein